MLRRVDFERIAGDTRSRTNDQETQQYFLPWIKLVVVVEGWLTMSETLEPALVFRCSQNRSLKEQVQKFRGPRQSQPGLLACALWGQPTAKKYQACQSHAQRQRQPSIHGREQMEPGGSEKSSTDNCRSSIPSSLEYPLAPVSSTGRRLII